jgi:cell division protein FtsL
MTQIYSHLEVVGFLTVLLLFIGFVISYISIINKLFDMDYMIDSINKKVIETKKEREALDSQMTALYGDISKLEQESKSDN